MHTIRQNTLNSLEYVLELTKLTQRPIETVADYKSMVLFEDKIRILPGISLNAEEGWLQIKRLTKSEAPEIPEELRQWVDKSDNPRKRPILKPSIIGTLSYAEIKELLDKGRIKEDDLIQTNAKFEPGKIFQCTLYAEPFGANDLFTDYIIEWDAWADEENKVWDSIKVYNDLFKAHEMLAGGTDRALELVWGCGMSLWKVENHSLKHPLVELLVDVTIDPKSYTITVNPRTTKPILYLSLFEKLEVQGVFKLREGFNQLLRELVDFEDQLNPFGHERLDLFLRKAVTYLHAESFYYPDNEVVDHSLRELPRVSNKLVVTDRWAIYLRRKSENSRIDDIETVKNVIEGSEEPPFCTITDFNTEPSNETGDVNGFFAGEGSMDSTLEEEAIIPYFPKPYNQAQIEISNRLHRKSIRGVVVQGPPGTGKTHTVANIICDHMARGKRILVAAKSETALEVLKKQIPEGIRDLVISMLTTDAEGLKELEVAVMTLQQRLTRNEGREKEIAKVIEDNESEAQNIRDELASIDNKIRVLARKQLDKVEFGFTQKQFANANDLAQWILSEQSRHDWLEDALSTDANFEPLFTDENIAQAREARISVGPALKYINSFLPNSEALPQIELLLQLHRNLISASQKDPYRSGIAYNVDKSLPQAEAEEKLYESAQKLVGSLQLYIDLHKELELNPWIIELYKLYKEGSQDSLIADLTNVLEEIERISFIRRGFLSYPVVVPDDALESAEYREAIERGSKGESPIGIRQIINKKLKAHVAQTLVSGLTPSKEEDYKHILIYLDYCRSLKVLISRWDSFAREFNFSPVDETAPGKWFDAVGVSLKKVQSIAQTEATSLFSRLESVFLPKEYEDADVDVVSLQKLLEATHDFILYYDLKDTSKFLKNHIEEFSKEGCDITDGFVHVLRDMIGSPEVSEDEIANYWNHYLEYLVWLESKKSQFDVIRQTTAKICKSGAPKWAEALLKQAADSETDTLTPSSWRESWDAKRILSKLDELDPRQELEHLSSLYHLREHRLKSLMEEIVRDRTFLALSASMSNKSKSALSQFAANIKKQGKGKTGVKTATYMAAAQKALKDCVKAVPCWVMPFWRIFEVMPAEEGIFDLMIVDEASQCDIFDFSALFRAKKILVVGDDKQVSPTAPFIDWTRYTQLSKQYLGGHPFASMMLPGFSLYDLALTVFPGGRIMLNEHFRCVEPIIRFSFQFYPDSEIYPLRIPKQSERLDPPLIDCYVDYGVKEGHLNTAEAREIVNEIAKITKDPKYDRKSIGIISLIGNKQAALIQRLIIEEVGQDVWIKHHMKAGDSATFQGREMDIMFLSMVASPGSSTSLTMDTYAQRFNVAASRAKDRMYLFRSITAEDCKNTNDLKLKLIEHFRDPMPLAAHDTEELEELCDSEFEKIFLRRLLAEGYHVIPQVPVGAYRIDLVVQGANDTRLAIELDGDRFHGPDKWQDDLLRQRILERVGWTFWRCWASSYTLDPEGTFQSLFDKLKEMNIDPSNEKAFLSKYTEYREYTKEIKGEDEIDIDTDDIEITVSVGSVVEFSFDDRTIAPIQVTITEDEDDHPRGYYSKNSVFGSLILGGSIDEEFHVIHGRLNRIGRISRIEPPQTT